MGKCMRVSYSCIQARVKGGEEMYIGDFAGVLGLTTEEAKEILKTKYESIILSDHIPFQDDLEERIKEDFPYFNRSMRFKEKVMGMDHKECETLEDFDVDTEGLIRRCIDRHFVILIDTCSLLNCNFFLFFEKVRPVLRELGGRILIPQVVMYELERKESDKYDLRLAETASSVHSYLEEQIGNGFIAVVLDGEDPENDFVKDEKGCDIAFADILWVEKMIFYRRKRKNVLMITQDHDLTLDLLQQNKLESSRSNAAVIVVKKIGKNGMLIDNAEDTVNPRIV